jgi:hypothetical protein
MQAAYCAAGCTFTDDPLIPGTTPIKAVHITELRSCIDALRARYGQPVFTYTDPDLTGVGVQAVHVVELRTALQGAYDGAGRMAPVYTDPTLTAGTLVKAAHIQELRTAASGLS